MLYEIIAISTLLLILGTIIGLVLASIYLTHRNGGFRNDY